MADTLSHTSDQLWSIARLLADAKQALQGHPAQQLIEAIQAQAEIAANDLDLLVEG